MEDATTIKQKGWRNSNVAQVIEGITCVIVPGGADISPTLYDDVALDHGEYTAERDVSDYLLVSYCLDMDIPLFAICQGMQMLAVASGSKLIQDIGQYVKEH